MNQLPLPVCYINVLCWYYPVYSAKFQLVVEKNKKETKHIETFQLCENRGSFYKFKLENRAEQQKNSARAVGNYSQTAGEENTKIKKEQRGG